MGRYRVLEPGIEVHGQSIDAILQGFSMLHSIAWKILSAHNLGAMRAGQFVFDREAWYSQASWLAAFEELESKVGDGALFQIGQKIPAAVTFPPGIRDIHAALRSVDMAYHMSHRKQGRPMFDEKTGQMLEGIGHYGYTQGPGEREGVSVCNTPYPSKFDQGILTSIARRFESRATVELDFRKGSRLQGADSCTYLIRW